MLGGVSIQEIRNYWISFYYFLSSHMAAHWNTENPSAAQSAWDAASPQLLQNSVIHGFSGKTRPRWGFQGKPEVTVLNHTFKYMAYTLLKFSSGLCLWFAFKTVLPPFLSPDLQEKWEKRAPCRGSRRTESWQEKPRQPSPTCLKRSAEREVGLVVSATSAIEREQK